MKLITIIDDFNAVHTVNEDAIVEFLPKIPNKEGSGAIELNNGHRIIVSAKKISDIVNYLMDEDSSAAKKGKKNG